MKKNVVFIIGIGVLGFSGLGYIGEGHGMPCPYRKG